MNCRRRGRWAVSELVMMVDIALDKAGAGACGNGDTKHDGVITIDEIVSAVQHALHGCS